jgi:hypothetical protein
MKSTPVNLTPYAVLLVRPADGDDRIRKTYHRQAQLHHPDAQVAQEAAGSLWYVAAAAYNAIKTPALRADLERRTALLAGVCAACGGLGVAGSRVGGGKVRVCAVCGGAGVVR